MSRRTYLKKQRTFSRVMSLKSSFSLKAFLILFALLIFSLSVFYIFQIKREISVKYLIQAQENKLSEILEESKNLEINSINASSLDKALGFLEESNLEKTDKIYYIRVFENEVVTK
jgi:cell division protein FtsL